MAKVLHLCLGGIFDDDGTYQDNILSKYHKKIGYDVTVVCSNYVWNSEIGKAEVDIRTEYLNEYGVKVIRLPLKKGDMNNKFKRYVGLYETMEKEAPNIIFLHGPAHIDDVVVVKYCKKHPKVTLYVDNHSDFSNSATNWLSKNILHKIVWRYFAQKLIPYAKKFYGVLPARVDFLTDIYKIPKENCELLVMGADDEEVVKAKNSQKIKELREKYNVNCNDFLIVTGGLINKFKYQTLILMEAVKKTKRNVKLLVFGSVVPEMKDEFDKLVDGEKIQYIGWIQGTDSYKYFAAADLVVFPGRHSVFWEQVTGQGKPMIVKDWPGTHHIDLGGNVEFLTDESADEIQTKIQELIDNPEKYNHMKQVAEEKGMKVFSYKQIAKISIEECGLEKNT